MSMSKNVHIHLLEKELLFDIGNYAYIEGDVMPADGDKARRIVIDVNEDENRAVVDRYLELAIAEVRNMLHPYVSRPVIHNSMEDDLLEEKHNYCVWMVVPSEFADTSLELLKPLIHEYLVSRVLHKWLSLTNYARTGAWEEILLDLERRIRATATKRVGTMVRGGSYF